jgi:hypothetical protein
MPIGWPNGTMGRCFGQGNEGENHTELSVFVVLTHNSIEVQTARPIYIYLHLNVDLLKSHLIEVVAMRNYFVAHSNKTRLIYPSAGQRQRASRVDLHLH